MPNDIDQLIKNFSEIIKDHTRWEYKTSTAYIQTTELYVTEITEVFVEAFNKVKNIQLDIKQTITTKTLTDTSGNEQQTYTTIDYEYEITFKDVNTQKILYNTSIDQKNQELTELKDSLKELFIATKQVYDDKQNYWKIKELNDLLETF